MKARLILTSLFVPLVLLLIAVVGLTYAQEPEPPQPRAPEAAMGTAFTYQGQLELDGEPVNEACEMVFYLYDDATADSQVSPPITETVVISDGLFTQRLDFGADAFTGDARWLGIEVMCPDDAGFTDLGREALTATPYALYASAAGEADLLGGLPASAFWTTAGNAGTDPAADFLGTTDATSLTLAVSGTTALRLGPTTGTPNVIGGYSGNHVTPGVVGATIGGGGNSNRPNRVVGDYATVGGGVGNTASGDRSTVSGGRSNIASAGWATVGGGDANTAGGDASTVSGGWDNTATYFRSTVGGGQENTASAPYATIAGGRNNTITGTAGASAIGGGRGNVITDSANFATIPGGRSNRAEGAYSFAAGRRAQALYDGDFVWADSTDADFAATGPDQFMVRATGGVSFTTGGAGVEVDGNTAWHAGSAVVTQTFSAQTTYLSNACSNYNDGTITIDAIGPGTVVVEANVWVVLQHTNGTEDHLVLAIGTTSSDCGSGYDQVNWDIPSTYPSASDIDRTFTVRRMVDIPSAGTYTYYLNGYMSSGYAAGSDAFSYARMHAVFYPD